MKIQEEENVIIAQAVIYRDPDSLLMVRQYVERGDIVWNFPGGGIEEGESPEEACIREVDEETGYKIELIELLCISNEKFTYRAEIIGGAIKTAFTEAFNEDIIDVQWIDLNSHHYFDTITSPIRDEFVRRLGGSSKFREITEEV